jgi:hypothetical protein
MGHGHTRPRCQKGNSDAYAINRCLGTYYHTAKPMASSYMELVARNLLAVCWLLYITHEQSESKTQSPGATVTLQITKSSQYTTHVCNVAHNNSLHMHTSNDAATVAYLAPAVQPCNTTATNYTKASRPNITQLSLLHSQHIKAS